MRLVVLEPATTPAGARRLLLGPLGFPCPLGPLSESLGDGLEAVGAALVAAERRPRPFKLSLPVRGEAHDPLPREAGLRLRRQVRQLLDNARARSHGLYLSFTADAELEAWLLVGGGDLEETDPGLTFGEFSLELTDCYLVGRPGTHRPARRLELADRRTGLVPRDSRGLLYSTDYAAVALPAHPAILPGDVVNVTGARGAPPASSTAGPVAGAGRRVFRAYPAADGEVLSYLADELVVPAPRALELEAVGAVRVWDQRGEVLTDAAGGTRQADAAPELYGWERVLGPTLEQAPELAADNGLARLVWLGPGPDQGLALEAFDPASGRYVRHARVLHALGTLEAFVVELTAERAVLEWRAAGSSLRAILQRGWYGPRLESYRAGGAASELAVALEGGGGALASSATPSVAVATGGAGVRLAAAQSHGAVTWTAGAGGALNAALGRWGGPAGVLALQTVVGAAGPSDAELAGLGLVDAQTVPVLLAR